MSRSVEREQAKREQTTRYIAWAKDRGLKQAGARWCWALYGGGDCLCAIGYRHHAPVPHGDHVRYWRRSIGGPWNRLSAVDRQIVCITSEPYLGPAFEDEEMRHCAAIDGIVLVRSEDRKSVV